MIYLIIYLVTLFQYILASFSIIVFVKGRKVLGSIILTIMSGSWVILAANILENINQDFIQIICYALGCATGLYIGAAIEKKLALGENLILSVINEDNHEKTESDIRNHNYGLTSIKAKGLHGNKRLNMIVTKRKHSKKISDLIVKNDEDATIFIEEVGSVKGGYIK